MNISIYFYSFLLSLSLSSCDMKKNTELKENQDQTATLEKKEAAQKTVYIDSGSTYSYATIAPKNAQMIYVSGINARGENGEGLNLEQQLQKIFKKLDDILKKAGSKPECITMIKQYTTRMDNEFFDIFLQERGKFLKGSKPASALIPMAKIPGGIIDVEIELVCYKCE